MSAEDLDQFEQRHLRPEPPRRHALSKFERWMLGALVATQLAIASTKLWSPPPPESAGPIVVTLAQGTELVSDAVDQAVELLLRDLLTLQCYEGDALRSGVEEVVDVLRRDNIRNGESIGQVKARVFKSVSEPTRVTLGVIGDECFTVLVLNTTRIVGPRPDPFAR